MIPLPNLRELALHVAAIACLLAAFAAGYHLRGPVESRQAAVRLDECLTEGAARIQRAEDNGAVAWAVGWGAVAVAQDMADRVIQGGSREEAARIKHYLTAGER